MTGTFTQVLGDLATRIDELERARDHLAGLLRGLRRMKPKEIAVPGVEACECVRMVAGRDGAGA